MNAAGPLQHGFIITWLYDILFDAAMEEPEPYDGVEEPLYVFLLYSCLFHESLGQLTTSG